LVTRHLVPEHFQRPFVAFGARLRLCETAPWERREGILAISLATDPEVPPSGLGKNWRRESHFEWACCVQEAAR
jgi:hypothetical protein